MGCFTLIAAAVVLISAFTFGPLLTLGWVGILAVLIALANVAASD